MTDLMRSIIPLPAILSNVLPPGFSDMLACMTDDKGNVELYKVRAQLGSFVLVHISECKQGYVLSKHLHMKNPFFLKCI